jgi:hypothetical protein
VARRWQARHGRGSPGGRLAHLRSDGVPGTGAASSPPPPAAASAPSRPRGACGDLVARGSVGSPRCRFRQPLRVPPVPPSGDAGEDGDEDQDRGHEDQQRPLLDEQVEHRTAAARTTAHLAPVLSGGGRDHPVVWTPSQVTPPMLERVRRARARSKGRTRAPQRASGATRQRAVAGGGWSGPRGWSRGRTPTPAVPGATRP